MPYITSNSLVYTTDQKLQKKWKLEVFSYYNEMIIVDVCQKDINSIILSQLSSGKHDRPKTDTEFVISDRKKDYFDSADIFSLIIHKSDKILFPQIES